MRIDVSAAHIANSRTSGSRQLRNPGNRDGRFLPYTGLAPLLIGPPGVGKSMLAICLARAAVDAGHRVYFTTAADLAARCHKAAREGRWNTCMRFFAGPRLLVIDELLATSACPRKPSPPCSK